MRTPYDNGGIAVILALSRGFGKGNFLRSLLSKWFRETPNDFVSPVGETSWSRFFQSVRRPGLDASNGPGRRALLVSMQ